MMFGLQKYFAMAGLVAALSLAGYVWSLKAKVAMLTAENAVLGAGKATCEAKNANITEDTQSDAEIDKIPDADLGTIPDRWLRPEKP